MGGLHWSTERHSWGSRIAAPETESVGSRLPKGFWRFGWEILLRSNSTDILLKNMRLPCPGVDNKFFYRGAVVHQVWLIDFFAIEKQLQPCPLKPLKEWKYFLISSLWWELSAYVWNRSVLQPFLKMDSLVFYCSWREERGFVSQFVEIKSSGTNLTWLVKTGEWVFPMELMNEVFNETFWGIAPTVFIYGLVSVSPKTSPLEQVLCCFFNPLIISPLLCHLLEEYPDVRETLS